MARAKEILMPDKMVIDLPPANYKVSQIVKGKSHLYEIEFSDGRKGCFPGTTGILGIISKPALYNWYAKEATENVKRALLAKIDGEQSKVITLTNDWIINIIADSKKKPTAIKDEAASVGSLCHAYFDDFIKGKKLPEISTQIKPAIDAFHKWLDTSRLQIVGGDLPVASITHGYGGELDFLAIDDDENWVLGDFKTSSGCWPEYSLQVSAYLKAFEETYGIECSRAVIIRFSKTEPVEFEVSEVRDIKRSFEAFLHAKGLQGILKMDQFS